MVFSPIILATLAAAQAPASFRNMLIAQAGAGGGFQPCEPSIALSTKDPKSAVAGVILDQAISTKDGGKTWVPQKLTSEFGVFGDPTVICDAQGNFHFFHLSNGKPPEGWLDRIVTHTSKDGGKTWVNDAGIGQNGTADQDKQWACAHPSKPTLVATWTQFDKYEAKDPLMHSNIYYSNSLDGGATWSKGQRINAISGNCLDDDDTTEGAVPVITLDGTTHVVWGNQGILFYQRTKDDGKTWLKHDYAIAKQYGGWNMDVPGVNRTNGMPVLMADQCPDSAFKNSLYVVFADQRKGKDDTDIFLIRSRDGGETWSEAIRVNQDPPGKHNFLPWLSVDPKSGYLYVVYYDRRAYADAQTDVYVAYSTNGGQSFQERKISEKPFVPTSNVFLGDYSNISAFDGIIAPIWTRVDSGKTSVWAAMIREEDLTGGEHGRY